MQVLQQLLCWTLKIQCSSLSLAGVNLLFRHVLQVCLCLKIHVWRMPLVTEMTILAVPWCRISEKLFPPKYRTFLHRAKLKLSHLLLPVGSTGSIWKWWISKKEFSRTAFVSSCDEIESMISPKTGLSRVAWCWPGYNFTNLPSIVVEDDLQEIDLSVGRCYNYLYIWKVRLRRRK